MDEKIIYNLLKSGDQEKENQGLKLLNSQKAFLLAKHRFPSHFNEEDRDDVFYWGAFKLLENSINEKFQFKEKGNLEAYLYTLISRRIYHKIRKKKLDELTIVKENQHATTSTVFEEEVMINIQKLFDEKLGENCRKILLMRYQDGMKQKEIAESLGLAIGTIKNNSSSCLNKLKKMIAEDAKLGDYIKRLLND